jgi:hypothetical protein
MRVCLGGCSTDIMRAGGGEKLRADGVGEIVIS